MKRRLIITSLILSGLLILDGFDFGHALAMFIIAGQIPGTRIFLDAGSMLTLFMGLLGFAAGRLTLLVMTFVRTLDLDQRSV